MSEAQNTTLDSAWRAARGDTRATIKLLRHQLQGYAEVPQVAQEGSLAKRRSARRQVAEKLPETLQRLLQVYQQRHPEFELEPICYLAFGSTDDNRNALELEDLPDEEQLVVLNCTESAADVTEVYLQTQTLLLRRRRKE
jgi:hypothetical protein